MTRELIAFCFSWMIQGVVLMSQVDPHFSQFYAFPMSMNPGMTGAMESDLRFTAIHRSQWGSVMVPFSTQGVSLEWKARKDWQFGLCFLNQEAGNAGYHYLNGYASIAYRGVRWGTQQVVIGLSAGQISRRFDPLKFQFGDQWSPITGFDPNVQTGDLLTKTSASVMDVGVGMMYWDEGTGKKIRPFAGASWMHLSKPQDPFISSSVAQRMPYRILALAGFHWQVNDLFGLSPHILFMKQGSATEKMLALAGNYALGQDLSLLPSVAFRVGDAVAPGMGLSWRNWSFAGSYDFSVGSLGRVGPGGRSMELSIRYAPRIPSKAGFLPCPRF